MDKNTLKRNINFVIIKRDFGSHFWMGFYYL